MKALLGAGRFNAEHSHSGNGDLTAAMQRTQGILLPHNLLFAPGLAARGQRTPRIPAGLERRPRIDQTFRHIGSFFTLSLTFSLEFCRTVTRATETTPLPIFPEPASPAQQ